ncbi:PTS fructose-like transporter subunit IIB [Rhodobacter capsulatus]|uniref:PTS system fructose-specific EIIB'BC component n=2 Tax=Rhodobacter capsulatus TaxID=1061 RepID=PTFBC_RHOCA|nr:PTS fructose-like transporter subunit IIB [Rhodobacter capsulatus]P23387.1 RecName: Full=PTS system fructose-specific EIIB'BC component; AltName: Full=EIIB'BC-Fru; Includes: RecName: Full=PTS system fructose-specific EIIB component; AltName: Full=EIII-Fru; AltName: Full=Fructose-specific phosphotransferase enzyme IIB component; Includes: RecName: Full=PTS system fructose-specific EIIC component; AltName: Full=Fructose permease IIC component [Rhodobacter capsulatus]ADE86271.1 PTS system, fructo
MSKIVAVTAGAKGVAHTHLAAEALSATAQALGHQIRVERHSAEGVEAPLQGAEIAAADVVLIAADLRIEDVRFVTKPVYRTSTARAVTQTAAVLAEALALTGEETPQMTTDTGQRPLRVVAITSCPTGIAHTFMAADALKKTAAARGWEIAVETQGSVGSQNALSAAQIQAADLVVIAADTHVDDSRFAGKKVYKTSVGAAVKGAAKVLDAALAEGVVLGTNLADTVDALKAQRAATRSGPYMHLLTGVSYMLPLVVAGGLLIALSFVFGIKAFEVEGTLPAALMAIGGGAAFKLMVPVLAGFIAYSIADRPGLTPGLIGGMLAVNLNAGFLGGIVAGFLAGYVARWLRDAIKLPRTLEGLKPVLILPLLSTAITGLIMVYVVGTPVAAILAAMTAFLQGLGTTNAVVLGLILGGMMAVDMGGPINKAAYTFAVGLLTSSTYAPMAAVMAAGMTPPLGLALATLVAKNRFTAEEREAGGAAAVLGLSFITEGAIPFAAKDPARVIPSIIVGSAITGALSMALGCLLVAPHGGIFVLAIPHAVTNLGLYALSIVVGTLVTTGLLIALKKPIPAEERARS